MKIILNSFLFLLISANQYTSNLAENLQGKWMYMDDMECPDVILLHKSGRYIIFNECPAPHYRMPIIEKGDWSVQKNKKLVLKNRELDLGGCASGFSNFYGSDSIVECFVKQISDKRLSLEIRENKKTYLENYMRIRHFPKIVRTYMGHGPSKEKIALPDSATLLKLSYKVPFYLTDRKEPIALIMEDQDGHELWKKFLVFTEDIQKEEVLIADRKEVINLTELTLKINAGSRSPSWEIKVSVY